MKVQGNKLTAEDGLVLRRIADQAIMGESVTLGITYYIGGRLIEEGHHETAYDYEEGVQIGSLWLNAYDGLKIRKDSKEAMYESLIRLKYSQRDELTLLRTQGEGYEEYIAWCKLIDEVIELVQIEPKDEAPTEDEPSEDAPSAEQPTEQEPLTEDDLLRIELMEQLKALDSALIEEVEKLLLAQGNPIAVQRQEIRNQIDAIGKVVQTLEGNGSIEDPYKGWQVGMSVEEGCWYLTEDGYLWEAIASGVPASSTDREFFDVVGV